MSLPLPSGKTQFCDALGKPLQNGLVYHYIPATSTPKDTYMDLQGTILNDNPVLLDSSGEATILGNGAYRQVVIDNIGNQLWDQVTAAASLSGLGAVALAGDTMTGTLIVPSLKDTGQQLVTTTPTADPISALSSLSVQGTTISSTSREVMASIGMTSSMGNGATAGAQDKVTLFVGMEAETGTGDVWAIRGVTLMDASSGTYNAFGTEIDLTNNSMNYGETAGAPGLVAPTAYGLALTGAGSFRATAAQIITGPGTAIWNRGIVISENSVEQTTFQDLGSAAISYEIQGTHGYGFDSSKASFTGMAIRVGVGQSIGTTIGGFDRSFVQASGVNTLIGDISNPLFCMTNWEPFQDNSLSLGASTNRWAVVWAVNGAIQTSDPELKTDITLLTAIPAGAIDTLISTIDPINFKWIVGGLDADGKTKPGKRLHWGWNAENVKAAFDAVGMDFGGYVVADDGTKHLRPDQLLPIAWAAVKELKAQLAASDARYTALAARVATLEAK